MCSYRFTKSETLHSNRQGTYSDIGSEGKVASLNLSLFVTLSAARGRIVEIMLHGRLWASVYVRGGVEYRDVEMNP